MKKWFRNIFWMWLACMVALSACTPEEDELFSDSSANRISAAMKSYQEILSEAPNGWLMEYYPNSQRLYGGYNLLVSFTADGKMKASSDVYGGAKVSGSTYSLYQSAGPVLSVDTYNEVFHFFSDPANPSGVGNAGKGMEGDFEFTIMSASPEKVVLQGKKSHNKIVMTPLPESMDWSGYLDAVRVSEEKMGSSYECTVGGESYLFSRSYRTLAFSYEVDGEMFVQRYAYIQTPDGLSLYDPIELNGVTVTQLVFGDEPGVLQSPDGQLVMTKQIPPASILFLENGPWFVTYSGLSEYSRPYAEIGCEAIYKLAGDYPTVMAIGSYIYTDYALNMLVGSQMAGALLLDAAAVGPDQVKLTLTGSGDQNGVDLWNEGGAPLFMCVATMGTGIVWQVIPDNPENPTTMKMIEVGNEQNVITVTREETLFGYSPQE